MNPPERRILHLDMDAFFASVELLRRPDLRGKPIVIGGRRGEEGKPDAVLRDYAGRGVVSTCTYEAREFGVRSGMPMMTAARLCPDAIRLPTDFAAYTHWSRRFKAIMQSVSPVFEDRGIDEAFLDITDVPGDSVAIARGLKDRIREDSTLTCSVGIAPNKLLAKISSELDKPDGITVIRPEDIETRIWPLPARRIPGIGPKADEKLKSLRIHTIGELAAVPLSRLNAAFGARYAGFMHEAAHGRLDRPLSVEREPKSRSRETTFAEDTRDWQVVAATVAKLSRQVADELREKRYAGRTIGIKLRFTGFETVTRDRTLPGPTNDPLVIRKAAFECLGRIELHRPVRLVGVRVGELSPVDSIAAELDLQPG